MSLIHQGIQREAALVWRGAKPAVTRLLSDLVIFVFAILCLTIMLITTYGLLALCTQLFENDDIYVKAACIIGELLLALYIPRITTQGKSLARFK